MNFIRFTYFTVISFIFLIIILIYDNITQQQIVISRYLRLRLKVILQICVYYLIFLILGL